ncbi:CatB-related O-acetyltransferase [uncultured Roseovarius sp.]|uniref:CatB-related O-acetyltransferase n=1 Tax=uncultured Roseovarius sp. TaxID=293344 RepID=UPI00262D3C37|nr:CatB-related O-acetyltransferase [uncultured Roseovarius sp.]
MPGTFPDAQTRHPLTLPDGSTHPGTVFLKPALDHPRIIVGDYTYASSAVPTQDWAARLAPYLFPNSAEMLHIGKFCQIADGVVFITASANHRYDGFSTYPFAVFDGGFDEDRASLPGAGADTVIGNDVWIGHDARILPGARVGDGVIIGAGAIVAGEISPYTIVVGNPARPVRRRFDPDTIAHLFEIAWWDWPMAYILKHEAAICGGDLVQLEHASRRLDAGRTCSPDNPEKKSNGA